MIRRAYRQHNALQVAFQTMKTYFTFRAYAPIGGLFAVSPHFSNYENCHTAAMFFLKCLCEKCEIKINAHDAEGHLIQTIITIVKHVD